MHSTRTGDVDLRYGLPDTAWCLPAYGQSVITLTLLDPRPGDLVLLAVQGDHLPVLETIQSVMARQPWVQPVAGAAVATYEEPTVRVEAGWNGCSLLTSFIAVAGLHVEGERQYVLTYW